MEKTMLQKRDELARKCKRFEYDESGLGKIFGYNCMTCTHDGSCKRYEALRKKERDKRNKINQRNVKRFFQAMDAAEKATKKSTLVFA